MPRLAFAQSFWDGYDKLEKPVRAGVRKAMEKFQTLSAAELNADKGLHLESVESARDPRMRTIRITDFWRGVVLAPDDGSDMFLLVNVLPHDDAYTWAAKRLYSANSATRALEVRNAVALDELTPLYETAARNAPELLFAGERRRAREVRDRAQAGRGPGTASAVGEGRQAARSAVYRRVLGAGVPARRSRRRRGRRPLRP